MVLTLSLSMGPERLNEADSWGLGLKKSLMVLSVD